MKRRHSGPHIGIGPGDHRPIIPTMNNFDHVRRNIRQHSRGLFSTPHQASHNATQPESPLPDVPSRAELTHLSQSYLDSIHEWYPVLHWPTFQREVDELYSMRTFRGLPREKVGLFFAVLACGSLQVLTHSDSTPYTSSRGQVFFDMAVQAMPPWSEHLTIAHAQAAFLISVFAYERNMTLVGSMWLASAVRLAQELQICPEVESGATMESELRRRLWWAIYVRDRYYFLI